MATNPQDERKLPWPEGSDPARLGDQFEQQPRRDDERALGESFADPNSADDGRLGKSFEESEFSGKKHHTPLKDRVHKPANTGGLWKFIIGFLIVFGLVLLVGWFFHHRDKEDTEKLARQQKNAKPTVEVTQVEAGKAAQGIVVPGTTIPLTEAYVYARANGYLKKRLVDIGDHVRQGQLLAIIDAPDLDAQVDQAREQVSQAESQLAQQKAQLALATVTVQRYRVLVQKGVFSRQDGDTQETNYSANLANVAAAQRNVEAYKANLAHQVALQQYEYVRAPFSGVVTQRNADIGALVSAGGGTSGAAAPAPMGQNSSAGGSSQAASSNNGGVSGSPTSTATSAQTPGMGGPLFAIAQNNKLRILVSVPEGYATDIHVGEPAHVAFTEYAGGNFTGTVTRTANSIDANTRTLLTEVQIDNAQGKFIPGMYTVVTFAPPPGGQTPILIVGDAVVIRHDLSSVAVVSGGKVHYVPVVLGRDFGTAVEILQGIKAGDVIVTDVTDDVQDGAEVDTHMAKGPEQKPQAPSQPALPGASSQYGDTGITDQNLQGQQSQQTQKGKTQGKSGGESNGQRSATESKP